MVSLVVALSATRSMRDAGDVGDARADRVAMRADARRLADHGGVEMRDDAAAGAHALDREGEEAVRRGALPLRIARREMHADVAVGERAEDGVDQRMQHHIGVGMAGNATAVRDAHAAEPDVIAVGELMHVGAGARAHVAERGHRRGFGADEVLGRGELHVAGFALEGGHGHAGPFGERCVVGEVVAGGGRGAAVRVEQGGEAERLRASARFAIVSGRWCR